MAKMCNCEGQSGRRKGRAEAFQRPTTRVHGHGGGRGRERERGKGVQMSAANTVMKIEKGGCECT